MAFRAVPLTIAPNSKRGGDNSGVETRTVHDSVVGEAQITEDAVTSIYTTTCTLKMCFIVYQLVLDFSNVKKSNNKVKTSKNQM